MLTELKSYLSQYGRVTLQDLVNRFDSSPDAMRGMLEHWIAKGRVRRHAASGCSSGGCGKCSESHVEIYEWVDR